MFCFVTTVWYRSCTVLNFKICLSFQVIDLGVILHPGSYLREFWNFLDAVVVICALISLSMELTLVQCLKH